jgi:hypothetical protein
MNKYILAVIALSALSACTGLSKDDRADLTQTRNMAQEAKDQAQEARDEANRARRMAERAADSARDSSARADRAFKNAQNK